MHISFTPERKRKFGKVNPYPSLIICDDIMEYSCVKSNTVITVYAHIDELSHYRYDEKSQLLELGGKFSVSCRNMRTNNETVKDYRGESRVLCFKYDFLDLEKFLSYTKAEKHTTIPKEMGPIVL